MCVQICLRCLSQSLIHAVVYHQQGLRRGSYGGKILFPSRPRHSCGALQSTNHQYAPAPVFYLPFFCSLIGYTPDVLQKRPTTPTLKQHTISHLKETTKSFEYTLNVLAKLEKQTLDEIRRLGGNEGLEKLMQRLHVDAES